MASGAWANNKALVFPATWPHLKEPGRNDFGPNNMSLSPKMNGLCWPCLCNVLPRMDDYVFFHKVVDFFGALPKNEFDDPKGRSVRCGPLLWLTSVFA
jgi:hypothetical protein